MRASFRLLLQSLVKPFYRQNAGFFLFLFLVFFGVVAPSQQLSYHYSLIRGLLDSPVFLGIVLAAWFLYALKCHNWVAASMASPELAFLHLLAHRNKRDAFLSWMTIQTILFLPVSFYALAVTCVALYQGRYEPALTVQGTILLLHLTAAARYSYLSYHPGTATATFFPTRHRNRANAPPYWSFFIRYWLHSNKALLLGLKVFGGAILYLLLKDPDPYYYDVRMPFLIYSLALFGHGVLIYRCRELEEKRLRFYRGLPVSNVNRFIPIAVLYFLLLLPEMLTIGWLTSVAVRPKDALGFILSGYSVLLLLHSVLKTAALKMGDFMKLSLGLFGILYVGVLGDMLIAVGACFFVAAGVLFNFAYRSAGS